MVIWWVMFCEIIPHVLTSWFPINKKVFLFYLVLHPIKSHVHCLGTFCLTVAVTMPLAAELSVFIGVVDCVKPSSWSVILRDCAVCPFWNNPLISASDADATTWLMILHSVWIGPFASGRRFGYFSDWLVVSWGNSAPPVRLRALGSDRYDASLSMWVS